MKIKKTTTWIFDYFPSMFKLVYKIMIGDINKVVFNVWFQFTLTNHGSNALN